MVMLVGLLHNMAAENGANVPDSEVWQAIVKSEYILVRYIPTLSDFHFGNGLIEELEAFLRKLLQIFANHSFGAVVWREKGHFSFWQWWWGAT